MEKLDLMLEKLGDALVNISIAICLLASIFLLSFVACPGALARMITGKMFFGGLVLFGGIALLGVHLTHRSFISELELRKRYRHIDGTWHYVSPRPPLLSGGKTTTNPRRAK